MAAQRLEGADLEDRIFSLGSAIFTEARGARVSVFDPEYYTGKLMEWAMAEEDFRVALFRFVDVLPALGSGAAVIRHVQEYFRPVAHRIPGIAKWGLDLEPDSLAAKAAALVVRSQVSGMAERFILGETPQKALKALRQIRKEGLAFTVDLLGEAAVSEAESRVYLERYVELIRVLAREVPRWPESKPLVAGHPGEGTPVNVSVKLSALYSQTKAVAFRDSVATLADRLGVILREAMAHGAFINVDMEDAKLTDVTLAVIREVLGRKEFREYPRVGMVFQTYLRRTEADLAGMLEWLRQRGTPITVRLVKGAYWDTETILAKMAEWPIPVWQEKAASDAAYERCTRMLLEAPDRVTAAFASHNIRSLCHAIQYAVGKGMDPTRYELQSLYGMAEPVKQAFARRGFLVRDYAPIGELIPGMGYLVRRLLENTSNQGFIRQGFHEEETAERLLAAPVVTRPDTGREHLGHDRKAEFRNSPLRDFSLEANREAVGGEIARLQAELAGGPVEVPAVIGGQRVEGLARVETHLPEDRGQRLARVAQAGVEEGEAAMGALAEFFPKWRSTPVEERAEVLFRAADLLEKRRAEMTATIVLETGKPWAEADADVAEAIDFLNYYGKEAIGLEQPHALTRMEGEENTLIYEPRGVTVVISPWNFPMAIPCGMLAAALVTGNTAALKPAEQSSLTAWKLFEVLREAGLPAGAAAFLPGEGETLGKFLVEHPATATIGFTGSKAVGLEIVRGAAVVRPGQRQVKRVIAEMGGKNAIVVDADADLDQAVKGILYSAFGYAGQKCSACSRLYVAEPLYERLMERLAEGVASLKTGPASDPATTVGPVIDEAAWKRLGAVIAGARTRAGRVIEGRLPEAAEKGWYVAPTVFAEAPEEDVLFREEFFGPILAVRKVPDFGAGLQAAMASEYALTGAVFTRSPEHLRQAAREFRVGNLYLNRGCTGALVGRHPFGGAGMSGVGSKAGGPDYLRQFVTPRCVSENTLRQGFAPARK